MIEKLEVGSWVLWQSSGNAHVDVARVIKIWQDLPNFGICIKVESVCQKKTFIISQDSILAFWNDYNTHIFDLGNQRNERILNVGSK